MTHSDQEFAAMYRAQRIDREAAVESTRRVGGTRRRVARRRVSVALGLVLTATGRALERLGEQLAESDEASPRACA